MDLRSCQEGSLGLTMEAMNSPTEPEDKDRKAGIRLSDADEEAMWAVVDAFPLMQTWKRATVAIFLMRVGMDVLTENPMRVLKKAPTHEKIIAKAARAKAMIEWGMVDGDDSAPSMGDTTFREGMKKEAPPSQDNPAAPAALTPPPALVDPPKPSGGGLTQAINHQVEGEPSPGQLRKNMRASAEAAASAAALKKKRGRQPKG